MYDQIRQDTIFVMLYAIVMMMAAVASVYLLFRSGNAFAADVTPPRRLRRWTAAFMAVIALGHLWYLPAMAFTSGEAFELCMLIGGLLDCLLTIPLALVVMLCMLQDRRRPLWPVWVAVAPLVIMMAVSAGTRSYAMMPWLQVYFLLASIGFTVYIVHEVRSYGRWLRDNYADLEHKELWQSLVVLAVIMFLFVYYVVGYGSITYEYIIQVSALLLIGHLLWRVETLQALEALPHRERQRVGEQNSGMGTGESLPEESLSGESLDEIELLLRQRCEDSGLYLQHDLTLSHLAQVLGTNRTYLSHYFSHKNTNYNAYINDLRIAHFERLHHEAVAAGREFTAQELASQSGYRSYRTFSVAFKQRMGQSVKEWMRAE